MVSGEWCVEAVARALRTPALPISLEPISYIGTCATEAMWDAGLGGSPAAICRYCKGDRRQDAPLSGRFATAGRTPAEMGAQRRSRCSAPRPFGLRPGRSAASLPSLTISTYGLRRAPRIRSVLATTHHAPIYEIGSSHFRQKGAGSKFQRGS